MIYKQVADAALKRLSEQRPPYSGAARKFDASIMAERIRYLEEALREKK